MRFIRLLIFVTAAALTAVTASANTFQFSALLGTGSQTLSLTVGGVQIGSYTGSGNSPTYIATEATADWYSIVIDYQASTNYGTPGLSLYLNSSLIPIADLASYNASGTTVNGLTGTYCTPTCGSTVVTDYGERPVNDSPNALPWSSYSFNWGPFEEQLTGYVWLGTGTPSLSTVPAFQQSGDSGSGDGDAVEPGTWWLIATALPLLGISKLRLNRAKVHAC
ncbi:MAG TPA: hypothetical protein VMH81_31120 [Bryobacteraceae bacterium]|nr:hypothetical protein [Bryobacteraceae bacterium]